jgi:hypothetical protein
MNFGNDAHQHLLVNHLPVFAPVLAVPILFLAMLLRKERGLLLAAVFLLVAGAVGTWLSFESGEEAYEMIQDEQAKASPKEWSDDVDDGAIAEHEDRAEKAVWWPYGTAALGLVVLVLAHRRPIDNPLPRWPIALLLVAAGLTSAAMGWVANAGGVIVHREIRGDGLDSTAPK